MGEVHSAKLAGPHGTNQSFLSSYGGKEGTSLALQYCVLQPLLAVASPCYQTLRCYGYVPSDAIYVNDKCQ